MNREVLITLIGCAIIFAGIGFVVYVMNSDVTPSQQERIPKEITIPFEDMSFQSDSLPPKTNDNTSIAESNFVLKIAANNTIPFGTISGTVDNPTKGHPVIIQFFKSLQDSPVHIAQVDVMDDNTFEYNFRVFSIDDGVTTHILSGDYFIKIFTTVNTPLDK